MTFTIEQLAGALSEGAAGVRLKVELEPLGGKYDKVFPPTYGVEDSAETRYAVEVRRGENGDETTAVALDSVASQANRHEQALLRAFRDGDLDIPVTSCDFTGQSGLEAFGRISDLDAPHRIYDAILRDSLDGEVLFRMGATGRAITDASPTDAGALFVHSPTTLVFGGWDSTGPRGGRGSKFERAFTSEVVAFGVSRGTKTSSRLDPLGVEIKAAQPYEAAKGAWTLSAEEAVKDPKGNPIKLRPSEINHGNVTPSIDAKAGGVTAERITATGVLSFVQLRRLRFPTDGFGTVFVPDEVRSVEVAARVALAALGICAMVLTFDEGLDLRSRCVLVPTSGLNFEIVQRDGSVAEFTMTRDQSLALVKAASQKAARSGLAWRTGEKLLVPSENLATLVRRSRQLAVHDADT